MPSIATIITIIITAVFSDNIVLNQSIGICPFVGVSRKQSSAIGMGIAVTLVIALSSVISFILYKYVLLNLDVGYLSLIVFILTIASLVQFLEIVLKKFSPSLYTSLGIYLPLITTNCAVLGTANALTTALPEADFAALGLFEVFLKSFFVGIGFLVALIIMSSVREKQERSDIPKSFRGFPIALLTAGIISLVFIGLSGLNLDSLFAAK